MRKKLLKGLGIATGVIVFSEICGIMGEVQAFSGMHKFYPKETDNILEVLVDPEITKDAPAFVRVKCKIISKISRFYIDNNLL